MERFIFDNQMLYLLNHVEDLANPSEDCDRYFPIGLDQPNPTFLEGKPYKCMTSFLKFLQMNLWKQYQLLKNNVNIGDHNFDICISCPFTCEDPHHLFQIFDLEFHYHGMSRDKPFQCVLSYNVFKCHYDSENEHYTHNWATLKECVMEIFHILWTYRPCRECLHLTFWDESQLCKHCLPHKFMKEYGVETGKCAQIDTCAICLDPVYRSHLECGHWYHKSCFIRLHTKEWYESDPKHVLSCPLCRIPITKQDEHTFFQVD